MTFLYRIPADARPAALRRALAGQLLQKQTWAEVVCPWGSSSQREIVAARARVPRDFAHLPHILDARATSTVGERLEM